MKPPKVTGLRQNHVEHLQWFRVNAGLPDRTRWFFTGFIRDKSFRAVRFIAGKTRFGNVSTWAIQRKQRRDLCSAFASKCVVPPRYAIVSPLRTAFEIPGDRCRESVRDRRALKVQMSVHPESETALVTAPAFDEVNSGFDEAISATTEFTAADDSLLASYFADNTVECLASPAVEEDVVDCATAVDKAEKKKKKKERKLAKRLAAEAAAQAETKAAAIESDSSEKSDAEVIDSGPTIEPTQAIAASQTVKATAASEAKPNQDAQPESRVGRVGRTAMKFESSIELESPVATEATVQPQAPVKTEPVAQSKTDAPVATETAAAVKPSATEEGPAEPGFAEMPLRPEVIQAVVKSGYTTPTAIQAEIIPHMLAGRDVLAQSQTGTGKTAAFALPILTTIDMKQREPQVLVLAPTRELAIQVARSFSTYGANLGRFDVAAIYGGQDYDPQLRQLRRGVQVVVGTPGRVIDHVKRGSLDLSRLKCLVLDEADEMLNMGFLEDVQFVLEKTPHDRQVALFSATLPGPIRHIADEYLNDPARITIKKKTATADSIRQRALFVPPREKIDTLVRLLEVEETDGVIVFTKTKDATISVAESLCREGISAVALNGDMPQKVRERTISQLKNGKLDVLVATDVAARGLDVKRISHVFNYDLPHDSESYIHRVGRTGRAGRKGEAIIFLTNAQRNKLRQIERTTKQPIEIVNAPTAKEINAMRVKRFTQRISDVSAEKDLTLFKEMITAYAAESGKSLDMIAAALAEIAQQGRPFLMRDRPAPKRSTEADRRETSFDRHDRGRGDDSSRSPRPPRQLGPPEEGMVRYRIDVGWQDGVKPGNIVGAVANEAGIEGQYIGPISIRDTFSTIDLPEGMPADIYQKLRKTWVSGKRLNLEVSRGDEEQGERRGGAPNSSRNGFKPRHAKGGKKNFSGGGFKKNRKPKG